MGYKKIGAILLVAGTCIGSGMIALPMVLAKVGLVPSILFMLVVWALMYYASLLSLELNLQAGKGLALGELGRRFSGTGAEVVGVSSLKLLTYALLAVYIYGGASILQELLSVKFSLHYTFEAIATVYSLCAILILLLPMRWIDYCNRFLFVGLLAVALVLIIGLALSIQWSHLPLFSSEPFSLSGWAALVPVVFTSFGFQVIFHTLTNYCQKNAPLLKRAFFWGSLIPAFVYILWTCSILSVVYHEKPLFYQEMEAGNVQVGVLIEALTEIAQGEWVSLFVWSLSLLAITTSILGVGVGLCDSLKPMLPLSNKAAHTVAVACLAVLPSYLVALFVPNAFITVLGFAGMILAVIAILLPAYLFWKLRPSQLFYGELKYTGLLIVSTIAAFGVIACELYNMLAS